MGIEIERKWLPTSLPDGLALGVGTPIRQGYLAIDEVSVRLRITPGAAWLTVKGGAGGLRRTEVEVPLAADEAEQLWAHTLGRRIEKVRHRLPVAGGVAEVDVFGGTLKGLCLVEVEFPDEAEALAFTAPPWFGREVTAVAGWSNAALSVHGRPDR